MSASAAPDAAGVVEAVRSADRSAAAARALGKVEVRRHGEELLARDGTRVVEAGHVATATLTDTRMSAAVADAVAARARFSDPAVHRALAPEDDVARLVFEIAEQLRCESQVPDTLPGVRRNLDRLFERWVAAAMTSGAVETELGIHLLTVAVVLRSRLNAGPIDPDIEDLLEATRFGLAEIIGAPLRAVMRSAHDQRRFGELALQIAAAIAERFPASPESEGEARTLRDAGFIAEALPTDRRDDSDGRAGAQDEDPDAVVGYQVFTREFDRISTGTSLGRPAQLVRWADELAEQKRPFPSGRVARIAAARLQAGADRSWEVDTDDGYLNPGRLGDFVARQDATGIFRRPMTVPRTDTAVTMLVDCSGSMRRHGVVLATLCDLIGSGLAAAGVQVEVLGFSTVDWHGGRSVKQWRATGAPEHPGRLGGTHHLVLADGDQPWKRSRAGLAGMLRPDLYAEGIDGEALQWAAARLSGRSAERRRLVVLTDGGPMSTATRDVEGPGYLDQHLAAVAHHIETRTSIELCALGVEADLSPFYRRSAVVNLDDGLTRDVANTALDLITAG